LQNYNKAKQKKTIIIITQKILMNKIQSKTQKKLYVIMNKNKNTHTL